VKLLGALGEEISPPSNPPWLKYVSVAQGVFDKYSLLSHDLSPLAHQNSRVWRLHVQNPNRQSGGSYLTGRDSLAVNRGFDGLTTALVT
jgi:hypothetical protein